MNGQKEFRVARHKRGWAVEEHQVGGYYPMKTVVAIFKTTAEAEAHAREESK